MNPRQRELQSFYTRIDADGQLNEGFKRRFEALCKDLTVYKGEVLYNQGDALTSITLNLSGLFRTFDPGLNLTLGFSKPLTFVPPVGAVREGARLPVSVQALASSRVLVLPYREWMDLTQNDFRWYRILWNLLQEESMEREAQRVSLLVDPAPVRYRRFLENFGQYERHIRISQVASYLGMTAATLSRIRSKQWSSLGG